MFELPSAPDRPDRNHLPSRRMVQGGDWHDPWPVSRLVLLLLDRSTLDSDSGEPSWLRRSTFRRSAFDVQRSAFNFWGGTAQKPTHIHQCKGTMSHVDWNAKRQTSNVER